MESTSAISSSFCFIENTTTACTTGINMKHCLKENTIEIDMDLGFPENSAAKCTAGINLSLCYIETMANTCTTGVNLTVCYIESIIKSNKNPDFLKAGGQNAPLELTWAFVQYKPRPPHAPLGLT